MAGPKLLHSGKEAMSRVAKILPTAHNLSLSTSQGPVELKPGTIWSGNKLLFYCETMRVYYSIDDRVYESGTGDFVRDEWLNALSTGAQRASGMVTLARVEFALLSGIFVPWYVLLGLSCAHAGLFYAGNKKAVDAAMAEAPKVVGLLRDLQRRSPTLFRKLMLTAAKELVVNLPSGVTAEDVAFFVGRVIKGAGEAPALTFGALMKIVGTVAGLVTATHMPSIAAHAVSGVAGAKSSELKRQLQAAGYSVTEAEAKTILSEVLAQRDTPAKLRELEAACKALLPSLETLKKAYGAMP